MAITDGLLHCWDLDEVTGTRADHVGGVTLSEAGVTPSTPGKVGQAAVFGGANCLTALGAASPSFVPPFTVAFWLWLDNYPTGLSYTCVCRGNNLFGGYFFYFVVLDSVIGTNGLLEMSINTGGSRGLVRATLPLTLNAWHLVVGWSSSVTPGDSGTTNLQIDHGAVYSTGNGPATGGTNPGFFVGSTGNGFSTLQGRVDQLAYWNRALTEEERTLIWHGGAGLDCSFQTTEPLPPYPEPAWLEYFHDATLDPYISYGCKVKVKFQTFVARMRQGHEERIGEWQDPLWTFDITPALRDQADLDYLIAFFRARNGPEFIFKFLNPLDYQVQGEIFGVGDGVTQVFQLSRRYPTGLPGDGLFYVRPIILPGQGVQVFSGGVSVAEGLYGTCFLGGTIVFAYPPASGTILTWSGMYYTPVRFFSNRIYSVVEHYEHFEDQLILMEERLEASGLVMAEEESPDFVDVQFPALYAQRATMGPELDTVTITSDSGGTSRTVQFVDAKIRFTVEETEQSQAIIQSLLAFFLNRKGRLYGFRARDITDFQLTNQTLQVADGVNTEFQLVKNYPSGGQTQVRTITKPTSDVVISVGGVPADPQPTIETGTGKVTFASPPTAGASITCTGTFDVPVRFDSDEAVFSIQGFEAFNLEAIGLLEMELGLPAFTIDTL